MLNPIDKSRAPELDRRDIHCHAGEFGPGSCLTTCLVKHPVANLHDEASLFSQWYELRRANVAATRVPPADQCFGTDNPALSEIDLRLVVHAELVMPQC